MPHSGSLKSSAGRYNPNSQTARPAACFHIFKCSWSQGFRLQPLCEDPVGHEQMAMSERQPERSLPGTAWHRVQRFLKTGTSPQSTHQVAGHITTGQTSICYRSHSCSITACVASVHFLCKRGHQKPDVLHTAFDAPCSARVRSFASKQTSGKPLCRRSILFCFGGLEW